MHHKSEQLYRQDKFKKMASEVDVHGAYHMFPFYIENNIQTIKDIALQMFH